MTLQKIMDNPVPQKLTRKGAIDLSGQKFGRYTVLYFCGRVGKKYYWYCECECGTKKVVERWALTSGTVVSCGCYHKEKASQTPNNLEGKKFGKLTVIQRTSKPSTCPSARGAFYQCKCDCGNIIITKGSSLISGHTTSCGCSNSKGELFITNFLTEHNIKFIYQKVFQDCKDIVPLRFDFQIFYPDSNNFFLCEYQGSQHYQSSAFFGQSEEEAAIRFEDQKKKDQIKRDYCRDNDILMIEIPYWDFNKIDQILSNELQKKKGGKNE